VDRALAWLAERTGGREMKTKVKTIQDLAATERKDEK